MWWNARRTASVPDRIAVAAAMALGVSAALALAACSKSTAPASGPIALWVANSGSTRTGNTNTSPNPNSILGFTASQIATGTTLPPAVVITTNDGNTGIALDANGNLWAANPFDNSIAEYSATQITKTGTPKPNVLISATAVGSLNQPAALAFDPHGNLWVANSAAAGTNANTLVEFPRASSRRREARYLPSASPPTPARSPTRKGWPSIPPATCGSATPPRSVNSRRHNSPPPAPPLPPSPS